MPLKSFDRKLILNIFVCSEAFILLMASIWIHVDEIELIPNLIPTSLAVITGLMAGVGMGTLGIGVFILSGVIGQKISFISKMRMFISKELRPLFLELTVGDIFILSATSGFCEEVFFRGVLQRQFGILCATMVFGIFHCPSLTSLSYGVWAALAGLILGLLYNWTLCLWSPIIAHAINNLLVLLYLRFGPNHDQEPA